jgi:hypothetical protein
VPKKSGGSSASFLSLFLLGFAHGRGPHPHGWAYAHLAACYKRTTDHCIAELNGCLTPGAWLKSSCLAGCFFQESLNNIPNLAAPNDYFLEQLT